MARRKYLNEYRIVETFDERGRVKTTHEYIGRPYRFTGDAAKVRGFLLRAVLVCLLGWIAFVWGFVPYSALSTALYIALPRAFCAVPLMMVTDTAISALTWKEPLEHRQSDKLTERWAAASAALAVLAGATCALSVVFLVLRGECGAGDVQLFVSTAVMAFCGAALVKGRVGTKGDPSTPLRSARDDKEEAPG